MIYDDEQDLLADALARFEDGDTEAAARYQQVLDQVLVRLAKTTRYATDVLARIIASENQEHSMPDFADIGVVRASMLSVARSIQEVERWHYRLQNARRRAGADAP